MGIGFEQAEPPLVTDGFEGDVDIIEETDNVDPWDVDADSEHTAERMDRKAIPPTRLSPKEALARSNPSVPSISPWYLSRLPQTSLTLSTMIHAAYGPQLLINKAKLLQMMRLATSNLFRITRPFLFNISNNCWT